MNSHFLKFGYMHVCLYVFMCICAQIAVCICLSICIYFPALSSQSTTKQRHSNWAYLMPRSLSLMLCTTKLTNLVEKWLSPGLSKVDIR